MRWGPGWRVWKSLKDSLFHAAGKRIRREWGGERSGRWRNWKLWRRTRLGEGEEHDAPLWGEAAWLAWRNLLGRAPLHCCGLLLMPPLPWRPLRLLIPAVHYGGPGPRASVDVVPDSPHKLDQGLGGLWDSMVWPYRVVKVTNESVCVQLFFLQGWRASDERDIRGKTQGLWQLCHAQVFMVWNYRLRTRKAGFTKSPLCKLGCCFYSLSASLLPSSAPSLPFFSWDRISCSLGLPQALYVFEDNLELLLTSTSQMLGFQIDNHSTWLLSWVLKWSQGN